MKRFGLTTIIAVTVLVLAAGLLLAAPIKDEFSVKQYNDFHDVLHPLQHEALPKNDLARIRAKSDALLKYGRAITKLGVPRATKTEQRAELKKELSKFKQALANFKTAARKGSDEQLKTSFSAVHDAFEMLAGMLQR